MGLIYFNAHKIKNIPIDSNKTYSDVIMSLGFNSIKYHPEAKEWNGSWSMDEKEYMMLVLKYG